MDERSHGIRIGVGLIVGLYQALHPTDKLVRHVQIVGVAVVVAVIVLVRRRRVRWLVGRSVWLVEVHASESAVGLQCLTHQEERVHWIHGIDSVVAAHWSLVELEIWVGIVGIDWGVGVDWRSIGVDSVWIAPLILLVRVLAPLIGIRDNILCNVRVDWLVPAASLLRTPSVVLIAIRIDLRLTAETVILLHAPLIVLGLSVAPLLLVGLRLVAAPLVILLVAAPLVAWLLLLISPRVLLDVSLAECIVVIGLSAASTDLEQDLSRSLTLVVQLHDL